jgi:hypothetical protein
MSPTQSRSIARLAVAILLEPVQRQEVASISGMAGSHRMAGALATDVLRWHNGPLLYTIDQGTVVPTNFGLGMQRGGRRFFSRGSGIAIRSMPLVGREAGKQQQRNVSLPDRCGDHRDEPPKTGFYRGCC